MGDSISKFNESKNKDIKWETNNTLNSKTLYPGDIFIYESPDGGKTVKSRPFRQPPKKDIYVQLVKEKFEERSQLGIKKYNTTLEREDLDLQEWLNHLQEELMDATLYIEKLKSVAKENS
jgi:hypothetical protein